VSYHVTTIPLEETGKFDPLFLDYLAGRLAPELAPPPPTLASLREKIENKLHFSPAHRSTLVRVLQQQYGQLREVGPEVQANITLLSQEGTCTVTTGHQLQVYLGPLYVVLKVLTAIKLAKEVTTTYGVPCVPVFWLASEDHDLAEIAPLWLGLTSYKWDLAGTGAAGMQPTTGLERMLEKAGTLAPGWAAEYERNATLGQAQRWLLNMLFGDRGLIVLDPQERELKAIFAPIVAKELEEGFSELAMQAQTFKLEDAGYKGQITGRDINLFLLGPEGKEWRERIVKVGEERYMLANGSAHYSKMELLELLAIEPERFSPNVVLRPLYQEMILPNIAYVGGPAETMYWLQLPGVFHKAGVPLPAIWPRVHAMVIPIAEARRLNKLGLKAEVLFEQERNRKQRLLTYGVLEEGTQPPEFTEERAAFNSIIDSLEKKAQAQFAFKPELEGHMAAERIRLGKAMEPVYRKIYKAWERRHKARIDQLNQIMERLLPGGALGERKESYLSLAEQGDFVFFDALYQAIDVEKNELLLMEASA
jgi:bacillithiol synthase